MENFTNIKHCIDTKGKVNVSKEVLDSSIKAAEELCKSFLGRTINVRGEKFIIKMLELYYGSAGDNKHDWYKSNFPLKNNEERKKWTNIQFQKGYKVYINHKQISEKGTRTRFDIVVGNENIAISFLVRSVLNCKMNIEGKEINGPNNVLKEMKLTTKDHGKEIAIGNEISLEDTSARIKSEGRLEIKSGKRIGIKDDIEWNFYLSPIKDKP